jgi:hypothetical protein
MAGRGVSWSKLLGAIGILHVLGAQGIKIWCGQGRWGTYKVVPA